MKKNNEGMQKPFFADFLENQIGNDDANSVQGGNTTKPLADLPQTLKYPSDAEDNTSKATDLPHTLKYPSDGDDDLPTI